MATKRNDLDESQPVEPLAASKPEPSSHSPTEPQTEGQIRALQSHRQGWPAAVIRAQMRQEGFSESDVDDAVTYLARLEAIGAPSGNSLSGVLFLVGSIVVGGAGLAMLLLFAGRGGRIFSAIPLIVAALLHAAAFRRLGRTVLVIFWTSAFALGFGLLAASMKLPDTQIGRRLGDGPLLMAMVSGIGMMGVASLVLASLGFNK